MLGAPFKPGFLGLSGIMALAVPLPALKHSNRAPGTDLNHRWRGLPIVTYASFSKDYRVKTGNMKPFPPAELFEQHGASVDLYPEQHVWLFSQVLPFVELSLTMKLVGGEV
jgi:hypothetical protein